MLTVFVHVINDRAVEYNRFFQGTSLSICSSDFTTPSQLCDIFTVSEPRLNAARLWGIITGSDEKLPAGEEKA